MVEHCNSFKINLENALNTTKKTEWFRNLPAFLEMHFGLDFVEKSEICFQEILETQETQKTHHLKT